MGLKLLMCFLSVAAGTMTGFYFYKREYGREKYFENMINLCNSLVVDMRFSQRTISVLIENYMKDRSSSLNNNLKEYLEYINNKNKEFSISKGFLKGGEHSDVKSFFKSLGTSDSQTQIFEIENYKNKFSVYKEEQSVRINKYAKNYIKLGFLFGLALGILLI